MKHKQPIKTSVFNRLLTYFLCVGLIPVVLLVGFVVTFSNTTSMTSIRTSLVNNTARTGLILEAELNKYRDSVAQFCNDDDLISFLASPATQQTRLTQLNQKIYLIRTGHGGLLRMHVLDASGKHLLGTNTLPTEFVNPALDWGVFRALESADGPIIYPQSLTLNGREKEDCILIANKVVNDGEMRGYVLLTMPQTALQTILTDMRSNLAEKCIVVDANNYLVYDEVFDSQTVFLPSSFNAAMQSADGETASVQLEGEKALFTAVPLGNTGIRVAGVTSVAITARSSASLLTISAVIVALWAAFCYWLSKRMAESIVVPIQQICLAMEVIEQGDLDNRVHVEREDEFAMMASGLNHMVEQLSEGFAANMEKQNRLQLAELKNLQAQISPHFLHNTLESIKWMARLNMNVEIGTVVEKLGVLLKSGMNFKRDMIPLRDELHVVDSYLAIQRIGYNRLTASIEVDDALQNAMVPNLVIQPLVENAVVHSMEQKRTPVHVTVSGKQDGDLLTIAIIDNGVGISQERLSKIFDNDDINQDSIGLANVHRRLQLYFGNEYGLRIESEECVGTTVYATMPLRPREDNDV